MSTTSIYRIKSKAWSGYVYLVYYDGQLRDLHQLATMSADCFEVLMSSIPQSDAQLLDGNAVGECTSINDKKLNIKWQYQPIVGRTIKEKVVMFTAAHKSWRRTYYQPQDREKANLRSVPVTSKLLDVFFQSPLQHFTIHNYVSRINITKDWAENGIPESKFKSPSHYTYYEVVTIHGNPSDPRKMEDFEPTDQTKNGQKLWKMKS